MFLSRSPLLDPGGPVQALLSLEEPEALQAAMNSLEPEEVALAIGQASTLDEHPVGARAPGLDPAVPLQRRQHPRSLGHATAP